MTLQRRHLAVSAVFVGLCAAAAALTGFAPSDASRPLEQKFVHNDRLGSVAVDVPAGDPRAFVFLLSDAGGLDRQTQRLAENLVAQGAVVVPLSTPTVLARLDATTPSDCHYALGLFEEISQAAQRALDVSTYRWPVILGVGEGGTLAYLAQAQAPPNTSAGAVSIGFAPTLRTHLPLCGQAATKSANGSYDYQPAKNLPGRWIAVANGAADQALAAFAGAGANGEIRPVAGGAPARLLAAEKATFEIADGAAGLEADALPVEELPAKGADTLVVFYSGDGGWRDIDKRISDYLNSRGVAVLGVDSLRYFWRKKSPEEIGTDLDRLIADYAKRWGTHRVALVGYSMGASILPFAWDNLSSENRQVTKLIALLSLDPEASFEVSISGYLGIDSSSDVAIGPTAKELPHDKVMCFFGAEERSPSDSGCLTPELRGATLIERPGGHHFDGDYEPIAAMILDRLKPVDAAADLPVAASTHS